MSQPQWAFSKELNSYYVYDSINDRLHFPNGSSVARPAVVPREALLRSGNPTLPGYQYSGSPPGGNSPYTTTPRPAAASHPQAQRTDTNHLNQQHRPAQTSAPGETTQAGPSNAVNDIADRLGGLNLNINQAASLGLHRDEIPRPITAQVRKDPSGTFNAFRDDRSEVRTLVMTSPKEAITDPFLVQAGIFATRKLFGTDDAEEERLFSSFKKPKHPSRFFVLGKVFMMLWVEPAGESTVVTYLQAGESLGRFGERVFSKVRRFVVVREGRGYCSCLPITTYGGRGVSKTGVVKSEHAIIYTGKQAPQIRNDELPARGEYGLRPRSIRVDPDLPTDRLDPVSRVDFARITTVQHNVKAKSFGKVNRAFIDALEQQARNVWDKVPEAASRTPTVSDGTVYPMPAREEPPVRGWRATEQIPTASGRSGVASHVPRPSADSAIVMSPSQPMTQGRRVSDTSSLVDANRRQPQAGSSKTPAKVRPPPEESDESSGSEDDDSDSDDDTNEPSQVVPGRTQLSGQPVTSASPQQSTTRHVVSASSRPQRSGQVSETLRQPGPSRATPAGSSRPQPPTQSSAQPSSRSSGADAYTASSARTQSEAQPPPPARTTQTRALDPTQPPYRGRSI